MAGEQHGRDMVCVNWPLPGQDLHACLATGHVPGKWRQVKVAFVPKPGRGYYTGPISPAYFLRKATKSLVDGYSKLCLSQPACLPV